MLLSSSEIERCDDGGGIGMREEEDVREQLEQLAGHGMQQRQQHRQHVQEEGGLLALRYVCVYVGHKVLLLLRQHLHSRAPAVPDCAATAGREGGCRASGARHDDERLEDFARKGRSKHALTWMHANKHAWMHAFSLVQVI